MCAVLKRNIKYLLQIERSPKSSVATRKGPQVPHHNSKGSQDTFCNLRGGTSRTQEELRVPCLNPRGACSANQDKTSGQIERSTTPPQERSPGTHLYERGAPKALLYVMQLTTTIKTLTHHIWRRAPPHISAIEEKPCPMYLEKRPPTTIRNLTTYHNLKVEPHCN